MFSLVYVYPYSYMISHMSLENYVKKAIYSVDKFINILISSILSLEFVKHNYPRSIFDVTIIRPPSLSAKGGGISKKDKINVKKM